MGVGRWCEVDGAGAVLRGWGGHVRGHASFCDVDALVFVVDSAEVLDGVESRDDFVWSGVAILEFPADLVEGFVSGVFEVAFWYPGVTGCVLDKTANEFSKGLRVWMRVHVDIRVVRWLFRR